jgi:hypothetical protein
VQLRGGERDYSAVAVPPSAAAADAEFLLEALVGLFHRLIRRAPFLNTLHTLGSRLPMTYRGLWTIALAFVTTLRSAPAQRLRRFSLLSLPVWSLLFSFWASRSKWLSTHDTPGTAVSCITPIAAFNMPVATAPTCTL